MPKPAQVSIFVVDDEHIIATTLELILNMAGFQATAHLSAKEALDAIKSASPDVLITDVGMPGMNGIELAIRFKTLCPNCKVILFSGQAGTTDLLAVAKDQGHTFQTLGKPVHPKELLAAIHKAAGGAAPRFLN